MDDLMRRVAHAGSHVDARWTPERTRSLVQAVERRQRAARQRQRVTLASLAVATLILAVWFQRPRHGTFDVLTPEVAALPRPLRLDDGSVVTPLEATSSVEVAETSPERVVLRLDRGGARFEVTHRPSRVFRVEVGDVSVEDLGTVFTVERVGGRARVGVTHGAVRVYWSGQHTDLHVGERGVFPPDVPPIHPEADAGAGTAVYIAPIVRPPPSPSVHRATSIMRGATVNDTPDDLLRAADVARRSGHPAEAVSHLRTLIERHPGAPGAPAAAFTLGRVLLEDLRSPVDAAWAFAKARALSGHGPLAEVALAREVECWSLAHDAARARERAETYLRLYPAGNQASAVRRNGGVE